MDRDNRVVKAGGGEGGSVQGGGGQWGWGERIYEILPTIKIKFFKKSNLETESRTEVTRD